MRKNKWWGSCKSCLFLDICPVLPDKMSRGCEHRASVEEISLDKLIERERDAFLEEWWHYTAEDYNDLSHLSHQQSYMISGGGRYQ